MFISCLPYASTSTLHHQWAWESTNFMESSSLNQILADPNTLMLIVYRRNLTDAIMKSDHVHYACFPPRSLLASAGHQNPHVECRVSDIYAQTWHTASAHVISPCLTPWARTGANQHANYNIVLLRDPPRLKAGCMVKEPWGGGGVSAGRPWPLCLIVTSGICAHYRDYVFQLSAFSTAQSRTLAFRVPASALA